MCGYSPGTAQRDNFGLPRVMQIIREEIIFDSGFGVQTRSPIGKEELEALAAAVKVVGPENVYPKKIENSVLWMPTGFALPNLRYLPRLKFNIQLLT